jgi:hypothetical protein
MQGDDCTGLYVVISGRVRTFSRRKSGKFSFESSDEEEDDDDDDDTEAHTVKSQQRSQDMHRMDVGRCV